jgi:ABC-type multidrug transport system fused ATPase/permease subunit
MAFAFLMSLYGDFMQAVGASQRIFEILDAKTDISLNQGEKPVGNDDDDQFFDGSFKIKNVCFAYPSRKETNVLTDLSFEINSGQTVALVGPSMNL